MVPRPSQKTMHRTAAEGVMKSLHRSAIFGLLLGCSAVAAAASASLNEFRPKVMPVLVQVNSHGKVTEASPAFELSPKVARLLRTNLDEMITGPAIDKRGRPMSSQFVINLLLQASPQGNGNYDAHFTYQSTAPVPPGSWYWVHIDGRRLALANRDSRDRWQRFHDDNQRYQPAYQRGFRQMSTPPINNPVRNTPASSPPVPGQGK
jgi:hypothetical protein